MPGLEKIKDGTLTARVQLEEGKPSLPSYIRRVVDGRKEAWALKFQGQGMGGCWKCGDLRHLEAVCEVHTNTNASLWEAAASASSLWEAAAAGSVSSRREQF